MTAAATFEVSVQGVVVQTSSDSPGRSLEGKAQEDGRVGDLLVAVGQLVLRERCPAAGAPGHRLVPLVEPAPFVTDLQEVPDVLDVGVGHRVVGVVPAHPLAEADRLLCLDLAESSTRARQAREKLSSP